MKNLISQEKSQFDFSRGFKDTIKDDKSPVSNGDLRVNELVSQISQLTPNIPIISEETVDLSKKNKQNFLVN